MPSVLLNKQVHNITDKDLEKLQDNRIKFHMYGKSDNCAMGRCSRCKLKKQCTCACHSKFATRNAKDNKFNFTHEYQKRYY